jgi:hypothetical protein
VILQDKGWDNLQYRRRLETFGADDGPGKTFCICAPWTDTEISIQSSSLDPKVKSIPCAYLANSQTKAARLP